MKAYVIRRIIVVLALSLLAQACRTSSRDSADFLAALEGQLVFQDLSIDAAWYILDLYGDGVATEQIPSPEPGIVSRDGRWRLILIEEKDTNNDGSIDWRDRRSLYLAHTDSAEKQRVPLRFPVGSCDWGKEPLTAICSFDPGDVISERDAGDRSNSIIYLVDIESGELLQQLSGADKSSWLPIVSPDASMVAFTIGSQTESTLEPQGFQVVDAQTGDLVYEFVGASARDLVWSPDSTRIAFVASIESGEYNGAVVERMYNDVFYVDFVGDEYTPTNITRTSRFTQIPAALTELGGITVWDPVWSPDTRALASVWHHDGDQQIWVTSVDGSEWAQLTDTRGHPYALVEWRP